MRPRYLIAALVLQSLCWGAVQPPESRHIAGGSETTVYDYPFVVLLVGMSAPRRSCTGTLINDEWVLTAAHCVDGLRAGPYSWDSEIGISHGWPQYAELRHATEITMHAEHDPLEESAEWEHDIALVRMNEPFQSRAAAAVALADPADALFLQPGTMETAVGWGGENAASMTDAEWSLAACPESPAVHLCTLSDPDPVVSIQLGDSGGPLLVRDEEQEDWVQVGIHSSLLRNKTEFQGSGDADQRETGPL